MTPSRDYQPVFIMFYRTLREAAHLHTSLSYNRQQSSLVFKYWRSAMRLIAWMICLCLMGLGFISCGDKEKEQMIRSDLPGNPSENKEDGYRLACESNPNTVLTRIRYQAKKVALGELCQSELQEANCPIDGTPIAFSGTFTEESCAQSCDQVGRLYTRERFKDAMSEKCEVETQIATCLEGEILSEYGGTYLNPECTQTCRETKPGDIITRIRYKDSHGECEAEEQQATCQEDGTLSEFSGSYQYASCRKDCGELNQGDKITRVRYRWENSSTCESEIQESVCLEDGTMSPFSGSFTVESCQKSCGDIKHGEQTRRTYYKEFAVTDLSQCQKEVIVQECNNGVLSEANPSFQFETCSTLPHLDFQISPEGLEKIEKAYQRAKNEDYGIYLATNADYFDIKVKYNGKTYSGEARLKGDWLDHYQGIASSLRVKLDDPILGVKKFSIQHALARGGYEILYRRYTRDNGFASAKFDYVNYSVNGQYIGIMNLEGHFDHVMIEMAKKREGLLLAVDEYVWWEGKVRCKQAGLPENACMSYFPHKFYKQSRVLKNPLLTNHLYDGLGNLRGFINGKLHYKDVFDEKIIGRLKATARLWGNWHGSVVKFHNRKYYYNPITKRIEYVTHDGNCAGFTELSLPYLATQFEYKTYRDEVDKLYAQSKSGDLRWYVNTIYDDVFGKFDEAPKELTPPIDKNLEDHLQTIVNEIPEDPKFCCGYHLAPHGIASAVPVVHPIYAYFYDKDSGPVIEIQSQIDREIHINKIQLVRKKKTVWEEDFGIAIGMHGPRRYLPVAAKTHHKQKYLIHIRIDGVNEPYVIAAKPSAPILEEAIRPLGEYAKLQSLFPRFVIDPSKRSITIPSGDHHMTQHLSSPERTMLIVQEGAKITLDPGIRIEINGAVHFAGTEQNPITLDPKHETDRWGGIIVYGDSRVSKVSHTHFRGIRYRLAEGRGVTGAISFYQAPINIENSSFEHFATEDMLNIYDARFTLSNVSFAGTNSDALDVDFGQGTIHHVTLSDIGGDGLDFSGSKVLISHIQATNIQDKVISAGEGSKLRISHINARGANIGVASKDSSQVYVEDSQFAEIAAHVLAAYIKKSHYEPCSLAYSHVQSENGNQNMEYAIQPCTIKKHQKRKALKLLLAGNAYGHPENATLLPHLRLRNLIRSKTQKLSQDTDGVIFLGNLYRQATQNTIRSTAEYLKRSQFNWFLSPGHHDKASSSGYINHAQRPRYEAFVHGHSLFLILDTSHPGWTIDEEQKQWLQEVVSSYQDEITEIQVFTHQAWWLRNSPPGVALKKLRTNSLELWDGASDFWRDAFPILEASQARVNFFAGNIGATLSSPARYKDRHGRFSFFATGMGKGAEGKKDGMIDLSIIGARSKAKHVLF